MEFYSQLSHAYFFAKNIVIDNGYAHEIDWQDNISFNDISSSEFLKEISWVVIASGMNDRVVQKIFPKVKHIMRGFESIDWICENREKIKEQTKIVFNHEGKINAILYIVDYIKSNSFQYLKNRIFNEGISYIQTFPYMGKATSYHLAKNIGLNFAKPDRHLLRLADILGFNSPDELCLNISDSIQEKASVIDLVLWRYCTLDKDYKLTLENFILGSYCKIPKKQFS
nr:hypothetical protein [uncultured Fluviicola sp.]